MDGKFDVNDSGGVDQADVTFLVENILGTFMGDANLDGKVDAADLNQVGIHWRSQAGAGWADGDFTGDGAVDARDLNLVGLNWRRPDVVAAVAKSRREPRAPLAGWRAVPAAIVDEAIVHVSQDLVDGLD